jgi:hypothetical protein
MIGNFFKHYGTPRHSGRYPWGSGDEPFQANESLISRVDGYRRKGLSEKEAATAVGMSIAEVRAQRSLEIAEKRAADVAMAVRLKKKGMSVTAIGERMGKNESSVRSLLNPSTQERSNITKATSDMLRSTVGKDKFVDVGGGVEARLGISATRLATSVKALKNEGYEVINVQVAQLGNDKKTTVKVLAPPGTTYKDVVTNMTNIVIPQERSDDGGRTYLGIKPPVSVSSKRIQVVYAEDGGSDKDGLIELRRGVPDISLGTARYAQVRIAVDGTHYLKGMALHTDKLPPGVDIRFNTNKPKGTPLSDTLKPLSDDPDNPFGSSITQYEYTDKMGKKHQSPINILGSDGAPNKEGRWAEWSRAISSQVLSKQPTPLAEKQLAMIVDKKRAEYEEISQLTNPAVKKRLLDALADDCDSSSIHLKAAALPRQMNSVLLPVPSMPDHQVFAPNYKNGEKVVLIRHPHGGKFEIPELTVNNNHPEAKRMIGASAKDAVGISPGTARRLSGADFDGDHVLVIPNTRGKHAIQTSPPLAGLKDFDPISEYPYVEGMQVMGEPKGGDKQAVMGDISNLITDMTIKGANPSEIERAVRHSMVVIDAEKHRLNYKESARANGIPQLKEKYQGRKSGGASTLISRASSDQVIPRRREGQLIGPISSETGQPRRIFIDPKTGEKLYTPTGESYVDKKGRTIVNTERITKMESVSDAHELSSGTTMEKIYADHANRLKALANTARRDMVAVKNIPYSPEAKRKYAKEVESLKTKLIAANANRPLERRAQLIANDIVAVKRKANPQMTHEAYKKLKGQALTEARNRVGAKKPAIIITTKEWAAIQSGAISSSRLEEIIQNADLDNVKALATPRTTETVSRASLARARSLMASGRYTQAEVAQQLGIATSTLSKMLKV